MVVCGLHQQRYVVASSRGISGVCGAMLGALGRTVRAFRFCSWDGAWSTIVDLLLGYRCVLFFRRAA